MKTKHISERRTMTCFGLQAMGKLSTYAVRLIMEMIV